MISWMQKHKKYLVITIWISTIAFVGAGFVGWGAYKFGSRGDVVAKVGSMEVKFKDLQSEYNRLYNAYMQAFGGNFDQAKAKELGLEKEALQILIQQALLENFAKEHGLIVTDEEVAQKIASMQIFWDKEKKFSKELYLKILANNRLKPKDFEESIKKEILLSKINRALRPITTSLEFETVASSLYLADKIEYLPIDATSIEVNVTQEELKSFYNKHKNDYLTPTRFHLAIIEVPIKDQNFSENELKSYYEKHKLNYRDKEGKILKFEQVQNKVAKALAKKKAKKEALKTYIAFKKGKVAPQKEMNITQESQLPATLLQKLQNAKEGETLKPVATNRGFIIAKLQKRIPPHPMSFEEAKNRLQKDLQQQKRATKLQAKAKELLKDFKGKTTDFITREDVDKLKPLNRAEALIFLKELFTSTASKGAIKVSNDKLVLYKILEQKLMAKSKIDKNRAFISDNANRLKESVHNNGLLEKLQKLYEIKIYKGF